MERREEVAKLRPPSFGGRKEEKVMVELTIIFGVGCFLIGIFVGLFTNIVRVWRRAK